MKKYYFHKSFSNEFLRVKDNFFLENNYLLKKEIIDAEELKKCPKRIYCIICEEKIENERKYFAKHGIKYLICSNCGHLQAEFIANNAYQDYIFQKQDYTETTYKKSANSEESISERINSIDMPKAMFILNSLEEISKQDEKGAKFLDVGCGSGFFLKALNKLGVRDIHGCDYSLDQLENAKRVAPNSKLDSTDNDSIHKIFKNKEPDVVTMLGSLEHFSSPTEIIKSITAIESIRFVVIAVPTFSLSTLIEGTSYNTWARQLSSSHTHLFSDESLDYLMSKNGFKAYCSWLYGQDSIDLSRMILQEIEGSDEFKTDVKELLKKSLNILQKACDESKLSSEIMSIYYR